VISLHTPLNDGTKHIINRDMIQLMKSDAIIVNVARGGVWDEKAVAEAVLSQKIGGIASDVYTVEPFPSDHPFCSLHTCENVCLTPHMAWGAYEARERLMQEVADNIASFSDGGMRNRIV
jgi:glycerate dehydrogenase